MKFTNKVFCFCIFSFVLISCTPPSGYKDYPQHFPESIKEKFYVDPLVFYEVDSMKARLDMYIEVPIENILYKKNFNSGKYESKIILNINIINSGKENKITKTYEEYSAYSDEEMSIKSKESQYYLYNYFFEPGIYKIEIKIKDINSKNEFKKSVDITVKDFKSQNIVFGDLMILSKYKIKEDGKKEITPLINNNIFGLKEFFVFFEIYNDSKNDIKKDYVCQLKDNKGKVIKDDVLSYSLSPTKNQKLENFFVMNELKKYLPEEPDFDFFLYDNENNIYFTIDIIDKSNAEIMASKKLNFIPKKTKFDFYNKPRMR